MSTDRDYLAEAEVPTAWTDNEHRAVIVLLGIGQQLRRIADALAAGQAKSETPSASKPNDFRFIDAGGDVLKVTCIGGAVLISAVTALGEGRSVEVNTRADLDALIAALTASRAYLAGVRA